MWGCSYESAQIVFPTHVGMFLCKRERACESGSLPHACGDVPDRQLFEQICYESSPRTWGCSFPSGAFVSDVHPCLPHASGDVPVPVWMLQIEFSPRMWWFSKKAKISLFCLYLESACYISAFNEPILVGSLSNHLCVLCRPSSSLLDRVWELWLLAI